MKNTLTPALKKYGLHIFSFLLFFLPAAAQQAKKYSFTHYGVAQGLGSNEVATSIQDAEGYIWVGTTNGLQRFDGNRFQTFRHEKGNRASLPANYVMHLMIDKKKNLWVHTAGDRIGIFNTRDFTFHEAAIRPSNPEWIKEAKGIVQDEEGNIILLIANYELLTYNEKTNEFSPEHNFISSPPGWKVVGIFHLPGTPKYILSSKLGMAIYNRQTKQLSYTGHNAGKEKLIDEFGALSTPVGFLLDQQGRLWFDNWDGIPALYCYDLKKNEVVLNKHRLLPLVQAYHELGGLLQQKDGTIWIKGLGILAQYREKEKQFQLVYNGYENEQSISFTRINDFFEDREQNIWVATNNNGLYRFNPGSQFFTNIRQVNRQSNKPGDGSVMSFVVTRQGTLLTGTWGDGIYHYDRNFNVLPLNIHGFGEKGTPSVWGMFASKDSNTIWLAAQPGLYKIDQSKRTQTFYNPELIKDLTVRQAAEDKLGNLWIGTHGRGLFKWNKEKGKLNFDAGVSAFTKVPVTHILKIVIDRRDYVWICTSANGVYVIDPDTDKILLHFGTNESPERKLLWDGVVNIVEYDDSTIAIAANGIHLYNTRTKEITKTIPIPESIAGNMASMEKDRQGYLWVSMTSGICRVNPKNGIFIHFDRVDGISNDYFITAASAALPDGRLVFGADNQLVAFDPSNIQINNPAPDISITGFKLMNKSLLVDSLLGQNRIELAPEDNSIAIEFSGLSYNGTYIIKYKLDELDKDWVRADKSNTAVYSYLPPGTFTFLVRSEDAEGNASKNVTKMIIRVRPPFWRTWWFLGLVIFAATVVLFWLDKLRMQKIRGLESVRTRIATSLTEDMSSSLSNINISSELAKTKIDIDTHRTKEYIGQISETSNRMVQAMYDMVWSIDPKNDTMADTIDRMKSFCTEIENTYPISINFDVDKPVNRLQLDMEHRYEILCIYKEAVTNAAKYSDGRYIKVSLRYNKSRLLMIIMDDGKGFLMTDATMLGRGISDMRRRAAGINAIFYIESEINTGTIVKVEMPV
ncbi:MAG TPA: two-component regulator propeller domain-containing protein [Chitinophagaceae bacterium]